MKEISRSELYELVWTTPLRSLAPRFEVSDVALRKACLKSEIPVPERGYWAKLAAGKPVRRIRLPHRPPGMREEVRFGAPHYGYRSPSNEELLGPIPPHPTFAESEETVLARIRATLGKVRLIKTLDSPHIAIRRLLKADDERREKQARSPYPSSWDDPLFDSAFERRRMRILNSVAMATAKAGARLDIRGRDAREITFQVYDSVVGFKLDSPANLKRDPRYSRIAPEEAKAKLRLIITKGGWEGGERWSWEDAANTKVEDDLEEIAVKVLLAAELQYREGRLSYHQWWVSRRQQVIEEQRLAREKAEKDEQERKDRAEKERIDGLLGQAEALRKAETIRTYVERVREQATGRESVEAWALWAIKIADDLDPVTSGRFLHALHLPDS
jgi:hypothetical protein